ncbi:unnamed protein product [Urochloa decumbens]|uniref:Uncharacterized protein n=1 Tax=Urochloa decumbens TaxID=240449 RepID=A0ABC8Y2G1_9POAL
MKPGAAAATQRSGGGTVAFSWEQEPGVSKQSPAGTKKKPTAESPRPEPVSRRTLPATAKKAPAPAPAPLAAAPASRQHRLSVPPPPGGPGAPAVSPPRGNRGRRSRGVRPRDDPFLAAYLACCTEKGSHGKGAQKLLGWGGLGLGLGLGLRGLGLSCKTSCGAVEECVVRMARIPALDDDED